MGYGVVAVAADLQRGRGDRAGDPFRSCCSGGSACRGARSRSAVGRRLTAVSLLRPPGRLHRAFSPGGRGDPVAHGDGEAAVGFYGGAYRLLESTFFITFALTGAFAPGCAHTSTETQSRPFRPTSSARLSSALVGPGANRPLVFDCLPNLPDSPFLRCRVSKKPPIRCGFWGPVIVLTGIRDARFVVDRVAPQPDGDGLGHRRGRAAERGS